MALCANTKGHEVVDMVLQRFLLPDRNQKSDVGANLSDIKQTCRGSWR